MKRRTSGRPGFSLVEVLAALTVIAVMVSLMLPAIQSSREAARRVHCINNLRQLALAVQNYAQTFGVFPPGVVDSKGPVRNLPEGLQIGWAVQMLPFLEQAGIHRTIDTDVSVYDSANATAARTRLNTLLCPSDPWVAVKAFGVSSYAGCHHDVEAPIDADNHGVFFLNSRLTYESITDGASSTIFFGEKTISAGDLGWMSGTRATLRNTGTPINGPAGAGGNGTGGPVGGFGSFHPGGADFSFGDGSVRFLSERIDPRVYRLHGHCSDGEMIDEAFSP